MKAGPNEAMDNATSPRAMIWVDGQNLFHSVKKHFDRREPDYDIVALSKALCSSKGWELAQLRFYSGVPTHEEQPHWASYWDRKLDNMRNQNAPIEIYAPALRYHNEWQRMHNGQMGMYRKPVEKGVDVRLALDMVAAVYERSCDVMAVFSQDSDLSEAVDRCHEIAATQGRKLLITSIFPESTSWQHPQRGLRNTEWICFDRKMYEDCLDVNCWEHGVHPDYLPRPQSSQQGQHGHPILERGQRALTAVEMASSHEHRHTRAPA